MKQVFAVFLLSLFAFCHSNHATSYNSDTTVSQTMLPPAVDTAVEQELVYDTDSTFFKINDQFPWLSDTIRSYIQLSTNEMVKYFVKDSSIVFMYDGFEKSDTGGYVSVRLGADVNNGDGVVFTTAESIYVDILSREVYVYDIAADSSHLWGRPQ